MAQPFHRLLHILNFMKDIKFLYEYQQTVLNLADNPYTIIVYCHLLYYLEEEKLEVQVGTYIVK